MKHLFQERTIRSVTATLLKQRPILFCFIVIAILISACATAKIIVDYVHPVPDIDPITYSSNRSLQVYVDAKIPDTYSPFADGSLLYTNWRATIGEGVAAIFKPHFAYLSVVTQDTTKGISIVIAKGEISLETYPILSYRILIRKEGSEMFRIEGKAIGNAPWQSNWNATYEARTEVALRTMQKDIYNKLFVSAEGKSFRETVR